jgi:hypothetical protein
MKATTIWSNYKCPKYIIHHWIAFEGSRHGLCIIFLGTVVAVRIILPAAISVAACKKLT